MAGRREARHRRPAVGDVHGRPDRCDHHHEGRRRGRAADHRMRRLCGEAEPAADPRLNGTYTYTATVEAFNNAGIHDQVFIDMNAGDYTVTLRDGTLSRNTDTAPGPGGEQGFRAGTYTLEGDTLTFRWSAATRGLHQREGHRARGRLPRVQRLGRRDGGAEVPAAGPGDPAALGTGQVTYRPRQGGPPSAVIRTGRIRPLGVAHARLGNRPITAGNVDPTKVPMPVPGRAGPSTARRPVARFGGSRVEEHRLSTLRRWLP